MSTTHVAGPIVIFTREDRVIQRCMVCGEKLDDYRPSCRASVSTRRDWAADVVPQFKIGRMIEVIDGNPTSYIDCGDFAAATEFPENFCLALVEM